MRFRKSNILLGALGSIFVLYVMYFISESQHSNIVQDNSLSLEQKIKELEDNLQQNRAKINNIGLSVAELLLQSGKTKNVKQKAQETFKKTAAVIDKSSCSFSEEKGDEAQIHMLDVYRKLEFDNPDGGAWKQGWDVHANSSRFTSNNKLKVFVVPHSHNDPGWIKTFEKYYEDQTRKIFNNMIKKLSLDSRRKMIWAEISYLDLWWKESSQENRETFKNLVKNGQIEIVTGGWVMNDEANTYYFGMIEQLTAGQEWTKQHLGVTPKNGWAIDPFGYSASMAYLLKRSGLDNMLIQRVHYAIKKHFSRENNLEFKWRQNWDRQGNTEILCHMMPFYSYDIPHTCGPDPKICCQFDFRRMRSAAAGQVPMSCPWGIAPVPITESNVESRATMLLDQYQKKATLYRTNVLFVPLGDDFRYDTAAEFDQQFINYQKLFDFMNSREDWAVEAQFGTLGDYFNELRKTSGNSLDLFPSLSGDFFTYADIDDSYWSGYYTSRPFYKHMDRVLEASLRSAEIIYSMLWSHLQRTGYSQKSLADSLMGDLIEARKNLGLFQHHDGIAGTEKDHVVIDYANRMFQSIQKTYRVIQQAAHFFLHPNQVSYTADMTKNHFIVDDPRPKYDALPEATVIENDSPDSEKRIVLYNSLASTRIEMITLRITSYNIQVLNAKGEFVAAQLSPVFKSASEISDSEYELSFIAEVPALGMTTYSIVSFKGDLKDNKFLTIASVQLKGVENVNNVQPFGDVNVVEEMEPFRLENLYISAAFGTDGLLKKVSKRSTGWSVDVEIQFVRYGARNGRSMSGAYLFIPDGEAKRIPLDGSHYIQVIKGPIRSTVELHLPYVTHRVVISNSPGVDGVGLDIVNLVNIVREYNFELAMRLKTAIQNGNIMYTDLNGLQMTRRERWDKLPIQAHYFPMPSMAYIEDSSARITIASGQPLGVASLQSGFIEVMMDRRLNQDDNRGVAQGVLDNVVPTQNSFRILFEPKICEGLNSKADGYPSLTANRALHSLLYPVHRLTWNSQEAPQLHKEFTPVLQDIGCDIHLVNLRTMVDYVGDTASPADRVSLILHRPGFDCCFEPIGLNCTTQDGQFSFDRLFPDYFSKQVKATSLTALHEGTDVDKTFTLQLKPMELYTFQLQP